MQPVSMFDEIDQLTDVSTSDIIHAPFGYAGSKLRSLKTILPLLPYSKVYVEPFGGSASVLMNRKPSKLEVFNDRYAGVVAFFSCMRDKELTQRLIDWIDTTIHSKEDFATCKETWQSVDDPVERAGRWLYMMSYSFSGVGRNWGRCKTDTGSLSGKLHNKIPIIWDIHSRFRYVQVENQSWYECMTYYDQPDAVFYLDPPYLDTDAGCYRFTLTEKDHEQLLNLVFTMQGFVAISGYSHPVYEKYDWDDRIEYSVLVTAKTGNLANNRSYAKEVLWIKEMK